MMEAVKNAVAQVTPEQLREAILKAAAEFEPRIKRGSRDHMDVIVPLAICCEPDPPPTNRAIWCANLLDIPFVDADQRVKNLYTGGVLTADGYAPAIAQALAGDDSGITLAMLSNIATGNLVYFPETDSFQLTKRGIKRVERMAAKG